MGPYVKHGAADLILVLAGVHIGCAALLTRFGKEPLPHSHETVHEVPPHYAQLLVTFRWLLPLSYLVSSAMIPFLPTLMDRLGIKAESHAMLAATWLLFRTIGFAVMGRSHGWHGRWLHPIVALVLMLCGFAMVALAYVVGGAEFGKGVLLAGLAFFGLGMAAIYAGAIYYAMEVGQAQVEAGGAHEGLIGAGYTLGPAIGLGAAIAESGKVLSPEHLAPAVLAVIAVLSLVVAGVVARRIQVLGGAVGSVP
jgi:MFS family permease